MPEKDAAEVGFHSLGRAGTCLPKQNVEYNEEKPSALAITFFKNLERLEELICSEEE